MFFASASTSTPIEWLPVIIPSLISLFVGIMTGGVAGYTGLRHLKIDAEAQKASAEAQKFSTSNMLINDALMLVNSMRDEVVHRGEENARLLAENQQLKAELEKYQKPFEAAVAGEESEPSQPKS